MIPVWCKGQEAQNTNIVLKARKMECEGNQRCHIGAADNPSLPGSYTTQKGKLLHMARRSEVLSSVGVKQLTQRNIPEDYLRQRHHKHLKSNMVNSFRGAQCRHLQGLEPKDDSVKILFMKNNWHLSWKSYETHTYNKWVRFRVA
jgi:hypothetical protein